VDGQQTVPAPNGFLKTVSIYGGTVVFNVYPLIDSDTKQGICMVESLLHHDNTYDTKTKRSVKLTTPGIIALSQVLLKKRSSMASGKRNAECSFQNQTPDGDKLTEDIVQKYPYKIQLVKNGQRRFTGVPYEYVPLLLDICTTASCYNLNITRREFFELIRVIPDDASLLQEKSL